MIKIMAKTKISDNYSKKSKSLIDMYTSIFKFTALKYYITSISGLLNFRISWFLIVSRTKIIYLTLAANSGAVI
jgi:hypothetical protein